MFFIRLLLYQISFLANWTFISFKKKINQWNNLSFSYFILSLMHSYHSNNTSPFFHHSPFTPLWFLTLISLYSSLTRSFVLALGFFHPSNSNVVCLHSNYFSSLFYFCPLTQYHWCLSFYICNNVWFDLKFVQVVVVECLLELSKLKDQYLSIMCFVHFNWFTIVQFFHLYKFLMVLVFSF